jgi:uncharacterized protein YabE (DUF348 family)
MGQDELAEGAASPALLRRWSRPHWGRAWVRDRIAPTRLARAAPGWLQGVAALGLAAGALVLLIVGLGRTRSALVIDLDGQRIRLPTHALSVGAALQQAGVALYPEDRVMPALEARLVPGMAVRVQRAHPVALGVDGRVRNLRTHAATLGDLLAEAGVRMGPGDEIWLDGRLAAPQTPLPGGDGQSPAPLVTLRRATALTLDDGGVSSTVHTTLATVGQVLQAQGIALYSADRVTPGPEERIQPGMVIGIERSVPVQIEVDGRLIRTRTLAATVAGVLGQEGIALVGQDRVDPGLEASIRPSMTVHVTRVRQEYVVEFEPIPFHTIWVADPELEIDHQRLAQAGQPGLTKRRYRVRYEDGQEVEHALEDSWAEQRPITKTLAYGTKIVVRTLETPEGLVEYWRKVRVYTTSYTAASAGRSPDHPRFGYTRLGWKLTKGIVAVDPELIPLKSKLYIPGYGVARAGDTGGGVKGKFVDLGYDSWNYQSWHWWTDVYLLAPAPPVSQILWILPDWPRYPDRRKR